MRQAAPPSAHDVTSGPRSYLPPPAVASSLFWARFWSADAPLLPLAVTVGVVAIVTRAALIFLVPIGSEDMVGWVAATRQIAEHGIANAYAVPLRGNLYPPAFFAPLWMVGAFLQALGGERLLSSDGAVQLALRLVAACFDAALAIAVFRLAAAITTPLAAWSAGLVYALNPAILLDVSWASQIGDPYYALVSVGAMIAILGGSGGLGAALLVVAAMIKPQALVFLLFGGFLLWTRAGLLPLVRAIIAGVLAAGVVAVPFVLHGTMADVMRAVAGMGSLFPFVQVRAHNLWFVLSGGADPWGELPTLVRLSGASDTRLLLGLVTLRDVGLAGFLLVCGGLIYLSLGRRDRAGSFAALASISFAFFMLCTRMHVNYVFPTLVMLSVLAGIEQRTFRVVLATVSLSSVVNWLASSDLVPGANATALQWIGLVNSLVAVGCFALMLVATIRLVRREPRVARSLQSDVRRCSVAAGILLGCGLLAGLAVALAGSLSTLVVGPARSVLMLAGTAVLIALGVVLAGRARLAHLRMCP